MKFKIFERVYFSQQKLIITVSNTYSKIFCVPYTAQSNKMIDISERSWFMLNKISTQVVKVEWEPYFE